MQASFACSRVATGAGVRPVLAPCAARRLARPAPGRLSVVANAAAVGTVKIIIQGRKLPVTDAIKLYVLEKMQRSVQNFNQAIKEVDVTLSARGGDTGTHGKKEQKVEVTIYTLRYGVVRVEDKEENLYAAIDKVTDKVERKMQKVKEIAIAKGKWPGKAASHDHVEEQDWEDYRKQVVFEAKALDAEEALDKTFEEVNKSYPAAILRRKVLPLDPITVAEAIEALEAVGHSFYVFREMETDTIQVVYKREASGYGLIVPHKRD